MNENQIPPRRPIPPRPVPQRETLENVSMQGNIRQSEDINKKEGLSDQSKSILFGLLGGFALLGGIALLTIMMIL